MCEKFDEAIEDQNNIVFVEQLHKIAPIMAQDKICMSYKFIDVMINKYPNVFVVAEANCHAKLIDPDIRNRFDCIMQIGFPDKNERLAILQIQTKDMRLDEDVKLKEIASKTDMYVGRELNRLCMHLHWGRAKNDKKITMKDFSDLISELSESTPDTSTFQSIHYTIGKSTGIASLCKDANSMCKNFFDFLKAKSLCEITVHKSKTKNEKT